MPKFDIVTKAGRAKLRPRNGNAPYFTRLKTGGYVGYRPSTSINGEGSWVARYRDDEGKHHTKAIGTFADFDEAATAARKWFADAAKGVTKAHVTSVTDACKYYIEFLKGKGRTATATDAEGRFRRHVHSAPIGKIKLASLKVKHVRDWFDKQSLPPDDPLETWDEIAAKQGANRNLATFKACLNLAYKDGLIADNHAWASVVPHTGVHRRRVGAYLTKEQRRTLLQQCAPDLKAFGFFLALTGMRPGAAAALRVRQWDRHTGTLTINIDKAGAGRSISLSSRAEIVLKSATKGLTPDDFIFGRNAVKIVDGKKIKVRVQWKKDDWKDPFRAAAEAAGIEGGAVIYALRHSAITDLIAKGMAVVTVAALTGTSVEMIELNYSHLQHDRNRKALDDLGF